MKSFLLLFKVTLFLQLAACVQVPEAPLRGYANAFGAARDAGGELYRNLDTNVAEAEGLRSGGQPGPDCVPKSGLTPVCFDPANFLPADERPLHPDIEVRVVTFETVAAYNEALIALATGETGAALGRRLDRLTGLLKKTVQLGGGAGAALTGILPTILADPVLDAFKGLAVKLETARANAAARQSITAEAETIRTAIDLMIADTPQVYELYRASRGIIATSGGFPSQEEAEAENARNIAFYEALGAYVVMLHEVRQSHDTLIAALAAGNDPATQLEAALDQALEIRAAGITFRDAIQAATAKK